MDGSTPLLNLCPSLFTVHPIKYHSVSFSDVYAGELDTLCPTIRHVKTKQCTTNPDLIVSNPDTKPSYYEQWKLDVLTNRTIQKDFFMHFPTFKKEYPGLRWFTTTNNHTRDNTQDNQKIRILSVTIGVEETTFLGSLKKGQDHHAQQPGPVIDFFSTAEGPC